MMRGRREVAGGGIAGLTVGIAFASNGWWVRMHEQGSQLCVPVAETHIWENRLRVLRVPDGASAGAIPAARHGKRYGALVAA